MKVITNIALAGAAMAALVSAAPATAATVVLTATGSGWCNVGGTCNNTDVSTINNHYTGESTFNDWFAFSLPAGQAITSAVLSIYNSSLNTGSSGFNLYQSGGFSYAGLASGPVIGSLSAAQTVGTNGYANVTLNSTGLSLLNLTSGTFVFGGSAGSGQFAGYTNGTPAATMTLQTAAVPELATWAMMILGMGAVGYAMRRRIKVSEVNFTNHVRTIAGS